MIGYYFRECELRVENGALDWNLGSDFLSAIGALCAGFAEKFLWRIVWALAGATVALARRFFLCFGERLLFTGCVYGCPSLIRVTGFFGELLTATESCTSKMLFSKLTTSWSCQRFSSTSSYFCFYSTTGPAFANVAIASSSGKYSGGGHCLPRSLSHTFLLGGTLIFLMPIF